MTKHPKSSCVKATNAGGEGVEKELSTIQANSVPITENVSAENNRKRLNEVCESSGYTNVRFWVKPNSTSSVDECTAEVLQGLEKFKAAKAKGQIKPSDDARY